jgi:hypothetical protein
LHHHGCLDGFDLLTLGEGARGPVDIHGGALHEAPSVLI